MRKLVLLFIIMPALAMGQVISEDFENGISSVWQQFPAGRWRTDSLFHINGRFCLHHAFDNEESGSDRIGLFTYGLKPSLGETAWKIKIRHAYNPSSSNNWTYMLLCDKSPENWTDQNPRSGYAIGVNTEGYDDSLRLVKMDAGEIVEVCTASVNWQNDIGIDSVVSLSVKRSPTGLWTVFISDKTGNDINVGSGIDEELFFSAWSGLIYNYSSSQDMKLWVDDIVIDGFYEKDIIAPVIDSLYFINRTCIRLSFNEKLRDTLPQAGFVIQPGNYSPANVKANGMIYTLDFPVQLDNKTYYELSISEYCDLAGNCTDTVLGDLLLAWPETGDIIISEIMFDPEPTVDLPDCEYIEILNNSEYTFNTSELRFFIWDSEYLLSSESIAPGEYIILGDQKCRPYLSDYGLYCSTNRSISLGNYSDLVYILNDEYELLHGLDYDIGWYNNELKRNGGWSLEIIDPDFPFSGRPNWHASNDFSGGSPGRINSVDGFNPDLERPVLKNIFPESELILKLEFTESIDDLNRAAAYWGIDDNSIISNQIIDPLRRKLILELSDSLREGFIYGLHSEAAVRDMAGNEVYIPDNRIGLPLQTIYQDIIINELLYDPQPGSAEYIEIYNRSDKVINLADHFILSYNKERGDTGKINWISETDKCLFPDDYYVITSDYKAILESFPVRDANKIFELGSLPSMPDKEGGLLLLNRNLELIDKVYYSDDMHFSMLSVTSGVSLERIDPDKPGTDPGNWRSASGTSGYGSPGTANSALLSDDNPGSTNSLSLSSKKISPDNDGFEDLLHIYIDLSQEQSILELIIYNDLGYPVRRLADNLTASLRASLVWDGCDDQGKILPEGIYIIAVKIIRSGSSPVMKKKVCTLVYNREP